MILRFSRRFIGVAAATVVAAGGVVALDAIAPSSASATTSTVHYAANGKAVTHTLSGAIRALHVHTETPSGYARSKFKTWTDQDHDCRNTRAEVLQRSSSTKVRGTCTITRGTWRDWYDAQTFTTASSLDIDHLVPLEEVWSSGARTWTASKREAYANDLADTHTLVAVSLHANRSKGDKEPDQWLPSHSTCRYIESWVIVKTRWSMTVDLKERAFLLKESHACGNPTIKTHLAVVKSSTKKSSPAKSNPPKTTSAPPSKSSGLDPRFSTCKEANAAGYGPYYQGKDPEYYWYEDRDGDGIDCER